MPTVRASSVLVSVFLAAWLGIAPVSPAATVQVQVKDNFFDADNNPATPVDTVGIHVGDTVQWVRAGFNPHTVTSGAGVPDGIFNGQIDSTHATFSHTFNELGTFIYYCVIHGFSMRGTVAVTPVLPEEADFGDAPDDAA
ncbi:MAG: hypothetical protein HY706_14940, partial [Candidatus Hydrogenedentes bacterium]|nr:hypothetical protein [Candidatus Hydrogenedentota bacterium]